MEKINSEKIRTEAKKIIDNFAKAIDKVKVKKKKVEIHSSGFREEGSGIIQDAEFRKRMFANAPEKTDDSILAEKKVW